MTDLATERSAKWLSGAGLRTTRQRMTLDNLLVGDGQDRHVTAESLFDAARTKGAAVSLATVYNTLNLFSDRGLTRECLVDPERRFYDSNTQPHHHFYNVDDGTLTDIPAGKVRIEGLPEAPEGFEAQDVEVVVRVRKRHIS